ncbi:MULTISPECIES: branched-chain amino acid ABC transporter permease [Desulfococcus]|jgi:branched-chain amino acid transport system permease protein|uniref:ABC-type transporter, integral membrane subunit n=1 Tax=Desulfococcus multivorans DSM 2059 TaxID=1121405 RepID=S7TQB0_DESML|nr:branched-chain amino acid ABC transporter permease [Desulfococcus multivorans]AOY58937.1 LivM2: high-affinity branched-chain amino acid transport system, permease protein [Desulfococcus multivorans]AQV01207.1 branched-chain amino acid ABC transporter permease [Desulfococcus multivorans]EPR39156.1 ABC-type transporter, integral membrane subunit [Desulfococcus multivorans DSM 2059]MDX9820086.1 branched-chain amino acid ABC transporter permease [Desulfococcus multivorans]SJZ53636.1 amino acid/
MQRLSVPLVLTLLSGTLIVASQAGLIDLYIQSVIMFIGINIILSSSLNIVNGYMGEFACGHAAFMAIGAYVASILNVWLFTKDKFFGLPLLPPEMAIYCFPLVLAAGGVVAALAGMLVAIPSFKTRGDYLAIITIAANFIVTSTIINMSAIGGARGFMGMKKIVFAMEDVADLPWMLIWVILGTVFSVWLIRRYVSSTYGKGIIAIHQDEIAAEIMGVNTNRMKLTAFMISSGLAGLAGGLFAHILGYINPGSFGILKSTECLVMVYLGGMGSLSGSVISAILFTLLLEGLRFVIPWIDTALHWLNVIPDAYEISQVWKWVIIPLILVLLMQFRPEGIMGNKELSDIFPRLRKWYRFK